MLVWEELQRYQLQGHTFRRLGDPEIDWEHVDVILSKRAWRMDEDHREYLDLAISEARKVRYPKGGKDDTTGDS